MDILKSYLPLCWFRANPLELARSIDFLKYNLIVFFIVQFLVQANMTDDPLESLFEVTLEILLTFGFVAIMLYLNKAMYALIQVATAFFFIANAISLLVVPVLVWLTVSEQLLSYYALVLLALWYYALVTFLVKAMLTLNTAASIVMSFAYFAFAYAGAVGLWQLL